MVRSHELRGIWSCSRPYHTPFSAAANNVPAGVQPAVDRTAPCHRPHHQSAHAARSRSDDRPGRWQQAPSGRHSARHHRADRWHSSVRGGNDEGRAGSGQPKRGRADGCGHSVPNRCGPGDFARLLNGAARPAWQCGQRGSTDRSGDWPRVLSCFVIWGGAKARGRTPIGARPSRRCRFAVPAGRTAKLYLSVQARTGAGRSLRDPTARAAPRPTCQDR
jgi:hypothetical protein